MKPRECPRCGCDGYEIFRTHSYCSECNFSPAYSAADDDDSAIPRWVYEFVDMVDFRKQKLKPSLA